MDINDIETKKDNEALKFIREKLGIPENESLRAEEINAIVEAIKNRSDPVWTGDPLEEYLSHRNE